MSAARAKAAEARSNTKESGGEEVAQADAAARGGSGSDLLPPWKWRCRVTRSPRVAVRSEIREWMSGERAAVGLGAESLAEPFELSADRAFRLCDECRTQTASIYAPVNVDTSLPLSCSFALRSAGNGAAGPDYSPNTD